MSSIQELKAQITKLEQENNELKKENILLRDNNEKIWHDYCKHIYPKSMIKNINELTTFIEVEESIGLNGLPIYEVKGMVNRKIIKKV